MRDKPAAVVDERSAEIMCWQLVARFLPTWDGAHSSPVIVELIDAHAAVEQELRRLQKLGHSWTVVLTQLAEHARRYRLPVLDGLRERNGLADTFGEQTVREVVR